MVISRSDNEKITELLNYKEHDLIKPFQEISYWIKQTELELESFENTIKTIEQHIKDNIKSSSQLKGSQANLASL